MTFMRKFMDILNMDNWIKRGGSEHIAQEVQHGLNISKNPTPVPQYSKAKWSSIRDPEAMNQDKVNLYSIRSFWKSHPQTYQDSFREATIEEYLLYGKTLMLWGFSSASPLRSTFPAYFTHECHISNPQKLQSQLVKEKYLEPASVKMILSSYKMQDLKIIADSIGCSKNGKKAELLERIFSHLDKETIDAIRAESNLYILSEKGRHFLQSNYDYVDLHRHGNYNISLYEFNKNRFPGQRRRTFNDNVYTLITKRIYQNSVRCYYQMMEFDYRVLYDIALSEHLYDIALDSYLNSLYLKSCCLHPAQYYSSDFYHIENDFSHEIIFTVHSAPPVAELGKFYNSSFIDNIFKNLSLPPSFLSNEEFKSMVKEMIESAAFDYNKYNQLIILRLRKYSNLK